MEDVAVRLCAAPAPSDCEQAAAEVSPGDPAAGGKPLRSVHEVVTAAPDDAERLRSEQAAVLWEVTRWINEQTSAASGSPTERPAGGPNWYGDGRHDSPEAA